VATFLEETTAESDSPATLGHHWREAGDPERAVDYFVAAAEQASRGWAKGEAVRLYNEALRLVPDDEEELRRKIRLQCAVARQMLMHLPDAESLARAQRDRTSEA
jgi:hypothetical protein